jgi:platelet-activating factor acetylhydrolase IB subunit alpha
VGHEHEVSGLAFIPSHADFLISCSRDQSIRVWDTLSGTCLQTLAQGHTDWVKRVAVSASGALFATASNDGSIIIWNTEQVLASKAYSASCIVVTLDDHEH